MIYHILYIKKIVAPRVNWSRRTQSARHFPSRNFTCSSWQEISGKNIKCMKNSAIHVPPKSGWRRETSQLQWVCTANPGRSSSRRRSNSLQVAMWPSSLVSCRFYIISLKLWKKQVSFPGGFLLTKPGHLSSWENPPFKPGASCLLSTDINQASIVKVVLFL